MEGKENAKSTLASSTPACDGERIFVNFLNGGSVHTTALDRSGKKLWQTRITEFVVHQGFASSPALYESLVLVSADNKGTGALVALDRKSGEVVWRHERPKVPNYTSPIILRIAGKDQALFTGCDLVTSLDPRTGKKLWEIAGATTECVTSTVTDGNLIFTSGGYPKNHISAVRADGSGEVVWESNSRVYVPSMLVREGHLYAVLDAGVAACFESATGKELWKGRIAGTFSSSPVLVGDKIFVVNEAGHAYIFKASPEGFSLIGENQLGDECFATPVFAGNRIYLRVATGTEQQRQEYVYCLGE
jgi:outer membrane protein assembly factor BamB